MAVYRKRYQTKYAVRETPVVTCTALILLDTDRLRRKAIGSLKRSRTAYSKAEKEWNNFLNEDTPAFKKWMNTIFGGQMTKCRELHEKMQYTSMLIDQINYENYITGDPHDVCYERVIDRIENPEKYRHEEEEPDATAPDEDPLNDMDEEFGRFEDYLNELFDEEDKGTESYTPSQKHRKNRIKQIYRDLARRIHPDSCGEMSPEIKNLWHAVQEAYDREDLEQLEVLQAHLDLLDGHIAKTSTFSHIKELTGRFRHALKSLRATIRKGRKDPAWGFSTISDQKKAAMKRGVDSAFDSDIKMLMRQLSYLETRLNTLKTPFDRRREVYRFNPLGNEPVLLDDLFEGRF